MRKVYTKALLGKSQGKDEIGKYWCGRKDITKVDLI
jgi:hypothetical protein